MTTSASPKAHGSDNASTWVQRWGRLVKPGGHVLDVACGQGRHMKWFAEHGHATLGIDRSEEALASAKLFGETVHADIEGGPWPLQSGDSVRQFDAVVVTNYLWRPLLPVILQSLSPGGLLIYETFSQGNGAFGKPSNPDFLLAPGELLSITSTMRIIAFEEGFLDHPPRLVQRIVAAQGPASEELSSMPHLYPL